MKKVKYPNLNDYDLTGYEELKGDILYWINGGTTMSPADQQKMAEAGKNGDTQTQKEIVSKYETNSSSSWAATSADRTAPAQTAQQAVPSATSGADGAADVAGTGSANNAGVETNNSYASNGSSNSNSSSMYYGNGPSDRTNNNSGSNSINTRIPLTEQNKDGYSSCVDAMNKTVNADIHDIKSIQQAYAAYYILQSKGYSFRLVDGSDVVHTFTNDEAVRKYIDSRYNMFNAKKTNEKGVYSVNHEEKTVRADIKNFANVEEAYGAYYMLGDKGYTFLLCDNENVVHTFNNTEKVNYYIQRTRNWDRNKYMNNDVPDLKTAIDLKDEGYLRELGYVASVCHKQGKSSSYDPMKNRKFVSLDGKNEYVFNEMGALVTDPVNLGTYNYSSPSDLLGHGTADLWPWIKWGTCPEDPTTFKDRLLVTVTFGLIKYDGQI